MKNLLLGENFINTVLDSIGIKNEMSSKLVVRYLMRAAMSGVIVLFAYVAYILLITNFEAIGTEEINLYQVGKFIGCCFFSFALIAIYYTKSELLTSNMMITTIGVYYKKITIKSMGRILGLCYLGNIIGGIVFAILLAGTTIISGSAADHSTSLGYLAELIETKQNYIANGEYINLLVRAIFCNFFINLAMLMVYSGNIKSDVGKMIVILYGVFMFCYLGLEHSVANSVLFIYGAVLQITTGEEIVIASQALGNVGIALIGNFIGGGLLIGLYYAFINDGRKFKENN